MDTDNKVVEAWGRRAGLGYKGSMGGEKKGDICNTFNTEDLRKNKR